MKVNGYKVIILAAVGDDKYLMLGQKGHEYVVALKDQDPDCHQGYYTPSKEDAFRKFWERHSELS